MEALYNDTSEADYMSDGEDWTWGDCYDEGEYDDYEEEKIVNAIERQHELNKLRSRRIREQKGKYIIIANKGSKKLYLQDQKISSGGYWTQFRSNARTFNTAEEANKVLSYFHLGNPRAVLV